MQYLGYRHLVDALQLTSFEPPRPACIQPVTRITPLSDCLAVPASLAPHPDHLLDHVLFALKHEGTDLGVLAQALPKFQRADVRTAVKRTPNSIYLRKTGFLWEAFTGQSLGDDISAGGTAAPLFDPKLYLTGPSVRNARWRIDFNGIGDINYCATVRRTPALAELLDKNILAHARSFITSLPEAMMDRAISWAYLHETQDSFAIEKEAPTESKARRFIQLLQRAHQARDIDEDYLVELQSSTISNPLDMAAAYRHEQNYLSGPLRGTAAVTYLPPPPGLCRDIMQGIVRLANSAPPEIDPLVCAAIVSFGFVMAHPFMDGNGRLSRFLIHQMLCRYKALPDGALLPISVAMKNHEKAYLDALTSFSKPARERWEVEWLDQDTYQFDFKGDPSIYRYWDATACVEFTLKMADVALEVELRKETEFLAKYDGIYAAINERFDIRSSDLSRLIVMCLDNNGTLSNRRRQQFRNSVPAAVMDEIEKLAQEKLSN
jgi:hypothetical protein